VDKAESESDLCFQINAQAVETLASLCRAQGVLLVQISTDYVFGQPEHAGPRRETDPVFADSVYARSKHAGELKALAEPRNLVVRTCGLFGAAPQGKTWANFPNTMLRVAAAGKPLRVVNDQHCTPSYAPHVAAAVAWLCQQAVAGKVSGGVYHVVNAGATTWYEFASELFRQAGLQPSLTPIPSVEYPTPVRRPSYSVLSTEKYLTAGGPPLPVWQAGLKDYLTARAANA
jgi:dTDP-4-dehydrorhamnose reductase